VTSVHFAKRVALHGLISAQFIVVAVAMLLGAALVIAAALNGAGWRAPALSLIGLGLGFVLFKSNFGFAGSFRAVIERGDASGFRAQAAALAICSIVFFPLLALGHVFGMPVSGFGAQIGISFLTGAFLFGIGMQIGGGCASGTLFALGGGDMRLAVTLAFFIIGSVLGAAHLDFWRSLPALDTGTSQDFLGWPLALALHLGIFAIVIRYAPAKPTAPQTLAFSLQKMISQPWPLVWGAVALAGLNDATLIVAGRPWGETSGFTLWGSKLVLLAGIDPTHWVYWRDNPDPLFQSVFADITSIMDFGIILGAALAAGLARRFRPRSVPGLGAWLGASGGGLLMGYGARLSDGCNIGAYFSALASGSLSGWVWVFVALVGSVVGVKLRPMLQPSGS
jgi:uncharacterized protein